MDLSFIQEQFDTFSTFFGAIEDIFDAIQELFGSEGTTDGGTLNGLSSYFEDAPAENGDADVDADVSSVELSSEGAENDDADVDADASSVELSSDAE